MFQTSDVKTDGQTDRQTRLNGHGNFVFFTKSVSFKRALDYIKIEENIQTLYLKYYSIWIFSLLIPY